MHAHFFHYNCSLAFEREIKEKAKAKQSLKKRERKRKSKMVSFNKDRFEVDDGITTPSRFSFWPSFLFLFFSAAALLTNIPKFIFFFFSPSLKGLKKKKNRWRVGRENKKILSSILLEKGKGKERKGKKRANCKERAKGSGADWFDSPWEPFPIPCMTTTNSIIFPLFPFISPSLTHRVIFLHSPLFLTQTPSPQSILLLCFCVRAFFLG